MDLRSNAIGLAGAKALKDALLENDTLGALYLQDNKISGMHFSFFFLLFSSSSSFRTRSPRAKHLIIIKDMSVLSEIRSGVAMNVDQVCIQTSPSRNILLTLDNRRTIS